jgi:hypothetical protein
MRQSVQNMVRVDDSECTDTHSTQRQTSRVALDILPMGVGGGPTPQNVGDGPL